LAEAEDKRAHDETGNAQVEISWSTEDSFLLIYVADNGPGVVLSENLFVPFFTTKSGGSGIGLALCRQIAESHDGALTLANRVDARGAIATLRLPFGSREQPNVDSKPAM
jgi:signal transduction histidine kinase